MEDGLVRRASCEAFPKLKKSELYLKKSSRSQEFISDVSVLYNDATQILTLIEQLKLGGVIPKARMCSTLSSLVTV